MTQIRALGLLLALLAVVSGCATETNGEDQDEGKKEKDAVVAVPSADAVETQGACNGEICHIANGIAVCRPLLKKCTPDGCICF